MWFAKLAAQLAEAKARRIRLPVWLQGEPAQLLSLAQQLLQHFQPEQCWWLGDNAPANCSNMQSSKPHQLLGAECDWLIINACESFNADKIAASAGALKAGGLWLLLTPPAKQWATQINTGHQSLLSYTDEPYQLPSNFTAFWLQQLQQTLLIGATPTELGDLAVWPDIDNLVQISAPYRTTEQADAVAAICKVALGHRRRPLVLLADRGCGKSAALGIAAAQLATLGKQRILLTAPAKAQTTTALSHFFSNCTGDAQQVLQFMAIDDLIRNKPSADLLLVDEAAAIPTPLLQQLLACYSRIVFASTEHGYEGTGHGFKLRFQAYLNQHSPQWRQLRLHQPIRYQQHDPLERLIRDSFLLNHQQPTQDYQHHKPIAFNVYHHSDWLNNPNVLKQVFTLLSFAHYQTQVKDLVVLLENTAVSTYTLEQNGNVLACLLLNIEGQFSTELATQIYKGTRRVQGHLLAQNLAFHLAQPALATQKLARIMRIAVWPSLQQQKLGSHLLSQVTQLLSKQHISYIGSSFGTTASLTTFWQKNGFSAIRLGHQQDKASNEPSLLVMKNVTGDKFIIKTLTQDFTKRLYTELTEYPANLDPHLLQLLVKPAQLELTSAELAQLKLFAEQKRPYELVVTPLLKWFNQQCSELTPAEAAVFIARLWQKQEWALIAQRFALEGKAAIIGKMQLVISNKLPIE